MTDDPLPELETSRNSADNDNKFHPGARSLLADIVMGVRFFSRYPLPGFAHEAPSFNRMAPALGFTGVVLGFIPAAFLVVLAFLGLPPLVAAGMSVAVYVVSTGAMAEDALADSADGLFGGNSIADRLEILRDSRHGTYGVTALVLFLLIRVGILAAAISLSPWIAACLWVGATTLARSGALWLARSLPPARRDGSGATAGVMGLVPFAAGLGISMLMVFILVGPFAGWWGLALALCVSAALAVGWEKLCKKLVGGQTGDLIGALQALLEIALLTTFIGMVG